jgi:hypothetical protein
VLAERVLLLLMIAPPVAGVALGHLSGGRLAGFRTIGVRALWLVWLAAVAQYAVDGPAGLAVVFTSVLIWLAVNLPRWPAAVRLAGVAVLLGAALNGSAIALNGRMPYDPAAAAIAGLPAGAETPENEPAATATRVAVLGDTIPVPPLHAVVSPGDLLIAGGACAFVVFTMRRHRRSRSPDNPEEVKDDLPHRPGAQHAGDPALHGRRAHDRRQLTGIVSLAVLATLISTIGAPHEHGG